MNLSEFDITYKPRISMKGQALVDFIAEFIDAADINTAMEPLNLTAWSLFVDGSSGEIGSRAGLILVSPEENKVDCAIRFGIKDFNNVTEYEASPKSFRLSKEM